MHKIRNITVKQEDGCLITTNLRRYIGKEIKVVIKAKEQYQYERVLSYLIDYFLDFKPVVNNGQTIVYHSWILKFIVEVETISLFEALPNGEGFTDGVDNAIAIVENQSRECSKRDVKPVFPLFNQMVVLSHGVLEGGDIEAVRYKSPNHMSGWWVTNKFYDGDIKSLKTMHYYHLAFARPELIKYLALPFGFRFFFEGSNSEVWFDQEVANEQ